MERESSGGTAGWRERDQWSLVPRNGSREWRWRGETAERDQGRCRQSAHVQFGCSHAEGKHAVQHMKNETQD